MRRILVTGGSGFIGSNFILYWQQRYPQDILINLDALTYAAKPEFLEKNLKNPANYIFQQADITRRSEVEDAIFNHRPDMIVHFAAESHVCNSIKGPEQFFKTNVMGTFNLLEEARRYWGTAKNRFHLISTDEVFGELRSEDPPFDEKSPYAPRSPYAASKAGADFIARSYIETYGMNITISNCSNNYGPNQHEEKLIPKTINSILNSEPVRVYGSGTQVRDWIHVLDHCSAIETILFNSPAGNQYCIGGETELTNLKIIERIRTACEHLLQKPMPINLEYVNERPTDDRRYAINNSRIRSLGWSPQVQLDKGLIDTVHWCMMEKKSADGHSVSGLIS